jgi:hypothetical protein
MLVVLVVPEPGIDLRFNSPSNPQFCVGKMTSYKLLPRSVGQGLYIKRSFIVRTMFKSYFNWW